MELFSCQRCPFRCPSWRNHIRHTFEAHSCEPNFSFRCDINGCTKTTSNYSTLMSHLSRRYRDVDIESPAVHSIVTSLPDDEDGTRMDLCGFETSSPNGSPGPDTSDPTEDQMCPLAPNLTAQQSLQRSAALFLLTLKERYQLTQSALDFTVSQVKEMLFYDHQEKVAAINTALRNQAGEPTRTQAELSDCLEYKNPFATLQTEHLQNKYYRENFGLVVSSIQL